MCPEYQFTEVEFRILLRVKSFRKQRLLQNLYKKIPFRVIILIRPQMLETHHII